MLRAATTQVTFEDAENLPLWKLVNRQGDRLLREAVRLVRPKDRNQLCFATVQ